MRVLHITNAGGFGRIQSGGAERAVGELSSALADRHGWDEYVYAPAEFLDRQSFSASVTKLPGTLESFNLPRAWSRGGDLQSAIRKVRPDLVVGHLLRGTIAGATAAQRSSNGKFVSILHNSLHDMGAGTPGSGLKGRLNLAGFRFVGRHAVDLHVAISKANQRDLIEKDRIPSSKIVLIHNWVSSEFAPSDRLSERASARHELGLSDTEFAMAIVGRLESQKNHEFVIRLLPSVPDGQLLIVGEGSLRADLEHVAAAVGVSGRVRFLGHRSKVAGLMEASDVVLVPSVFEGFGRTVVEALAVGTPLVVSDLEPIREILEMLPNAPCDIAPVNDSAAWIRSLNDRRRAQRATYDERCELAAVVQSKFSLAASASAYDAAFRHLLSEVPGKGRSPE